MDLRGYLKKSEPFIALAILIMLILILVQFRAHNNLQNEINENCGWSEENYYCYCEYSDVMNYKKLMENNLSLENVQVDG